MKLNVAALQVRALNAGGAVLKSLGLSPVSFHEGFLMRQAERETGLKDFGEQDFLPPLRKIAESIRHEAGFSVSRELNERRWFIEILKRRLYIQRDLAKHPEIGQVPITRPIFIIAMPRSGTTLLQSLLLTDRDTRWLRPWELEEPWPQRNAGEPDPREQAFARRVEWLRANQPHLDRIHALDAPADCDILFLPTFHANLIAVGLGLRSYDRWLSELSWQDWVAPYRYYRSQLQRLLWRQPGAHWVLKSPLHLGYLPTLFEVFPDAQVIHLHRDPKKSVPSTCSMVLAQWKQKRKNVDTRELGRFISNRLALRVDRALEAREMLKDDPRIQDLRYTDLLQDPIGSVERIYQRFGRTVDGAMADGMKAWMRENPQHKRGVHRYDGAAYGLEAEELDRRFARYRERFGVETES